MHQRARGDIKPEHQESHSVGNTAQQRSTVSREANDLYKLCSQKELIPRHCDGAS